MWKIESATAGPNLKIIYQISMVTIATDLAMPTQWKRRFQLGPGDELCAVTPLQEDYASK